MMIDEKKKTMTIEYTFDELHAFSEHVTWDIYEQDLRHRLQAGHLSSALALCSEILGDIEAVVDAANG